MNCIEFIFIVMTLNIYFCVHQNNTNDVHKSHHDNQILGEWGLPVHLRCDEALSSVTTQCHLKVQTIKIKSVKKQLN